MAEPSLEGATPPTISSQHKTCQLNLSSQEVLRNHVGRKASLNQEGSEETSCLNHANV
jgi:hypothetical protein